MINIVFLVDGRVYYQYILPIMLPLQRIYEDAFDADENDDAEFASYFSGCIAYEDRFDDAKFYRSFRCAEADISRHTYANTYIS